MNGLTVLIVGVVLIILAIVVFKILIEILSMVKTLILNTIVGLIALFALNFIGFNIPIKIWSIAVTAIFGLVGVGVLLVLSFFNVI